MEWNIWTTIFALFFFMRAGFELLLDLLQTSYLKNRVDQVPAHLAGQVTLETIREAVAYNRHKLKFSVFMGLHAAVSLWVMVLFGFEWIDEFVRGFSLGNILSGLGFFYLLSVASAIWNFPATLYNTFVIETKHGFNRQTFKEFMGDKLKETIISLILGTALVSAVLWLMGGGGPNWWIYAFAGVAVFQLLLTWAYPVLIMPLFNKFTPVAGELADAVSGLADRVGFPLKGVMAMDGSRRSAHSNAFIIGLSGARRIVLYDTLIERIGQPALLAVLAHELGHFKLKHLLRRLAFVMLMLLGLFAALAVLRHQPALFAGLGFSGQSDYAALVVFSLLVSELLAPFGWLSRYLSRRDEFAADRFSVDAVENSRDLETALVELTTQNLGSPGSHWLYRSYYNTHPPLRQRLGAMRAHAAANGFR